MQLDQVHTFAGFAKKKIRTECMTMPNPKWRFFRKKIISAELCVCGLLQDWSLAENRLKKLFGCRNLLDHRYFNTTKKDTILTASDYLWLPKGHHKHSWFARSLQVYHHHVNGERCFRHFITLENCFSEQRNNDVQGTHARPQLTHPAHMQQKWATPHPQLN